MSKRSGMVSNSHPENLKTFFKKEYHQKILNKSTDVPEMTPDFPIALSEVGISDKTVWINLPYGKIPFNAEITTNLSGAFKGIHMSRIEKIIADLYEKQFKDLKEYGLILAKALLDTQNSNLARVYLNGKIPYISKTSISEKSSIDHIKISYEVIWKKGVTNPLSSMLGLTVFHITACPCTQEYNKSLFKTDNEKIPLPTHSQRCETSLCIEDKKNCIDYNDLLNCLKNPLHLIQDLLKRPDEAELILACHNKPQFAEDVVRQISFEIIKRLNDKIADDAFIKISSKSFESIHIHNVICRIKSSFKSLKDALMA